MIDLEYLYSGNVQEFQMEYRKRKIKGSVGVSAVGTNAELVQVNRGYYCFYTRFMLARINRKLLHF